MRFTNPTVSNRLTILPLLSVALVPVTVVLALVCTSMNRAEEAVRLPAGIACPPVVRESPVISVRLSRENAVSIAAQAVAAGDEPVAWKREAAAVRLLGFTPSQATVVVHADVDAPIAFIRQLTDTAERAGFRDFAFRGGPDP